jgi:hypothetical protein
MRHRNKDERTAEMKSGNETEVGREVKSTKCDVNKERFEEGRKGTIREMCSANWNRQIQISIKECRYFKFKYLLKAIR